MKHYYVVAAVIQYEGKYLCMQKGQTKYAYTSYKYEFPGGKVEEGESAPDALLREIQEEMNYEIQIVRHLITVEHVYSDFSITMEAFICAAHSSAFVMNEHVAFQWLDVTQLKYLDWAAADIGIIEALLKV